MFQAVKTALNYPPSNAIRTVKWLDLAESFNNVDTEQHRNYHFKLMRQVVIPSVKIIVAHVSGRQNSSQLSTK